VLIGLVHVSLYFRRRFYGAEDHAGDQPVAIGRGPGG